MSTSYGASLRALRSMARFRSAPPYGRVCPEGHHCASLGQQLGFLRNILGANFNIHYEEFSRTDYGKTHIYFNKPLVYI